LKLERGVRSPLSLAQHHHQHHQQQIQQQHHQQQLMDYGLSRMSSNSMLAIGGANNILNNNLATSTTIENGATNRESLRMSSPINGSSGNNNNSTSEQMLSPGSHQPTTANPSQGEIKLKRPSKLFRGCSEAKNLFMKSYKSFLMLGNEVVNEIRLERGSPTGVHLDQANNFFHL